MPATQRKRLPRASDRQSPAEPMGGHAQKYNGMILRPFRKHKATCRHARFHQEILFERPGHRPGNGQHPDLCQGQGHRAGRAFGGGDPDRHGPGRQAHHHGRGPRGQADAGQGSRQHAGHPPDEGRRDCRLHGHRTDAQAVRAHGASGHGVRAQPAHRHLCSLWLHPGGAARHPRIGAGRRRFRGVSAGRTRGGCHRCRAAGLRSHRLDGDRHRRRHHRNWRDFPGRHRARQFAARGR